MEGKKAIINIFKEFFSIKKTGRKDRALECY